MTKAMPTFLIILLLVCACVSRCIAADVILIGDGQLRPVVEIAAGIRKTLSASTKQYSPAEVKTNLKTIVDREGARVVIALGREALDEALALPQDVPVIYGLVVIPPKITRPNTSGVYMAIPARNSLDLVASHLPSLKRIAVAGNRSQIKVLGGESGAPISYVEAKNAYELVNSLRQLSSTDAILLLPDASLLTTTAMEELYLLSFRKNVPLLGISEKQVKEGALLALVVDTVQVGRQIGELASRAIKTGQTGQASSIPPRRFELFLNLDTARRMGVGIPDDLLHMAKKVYP